MPGIRSRLGCEECRRRRRKCDESKPICSQCSTFNRTCNYSLRLIWGGRKPRAPQSVSQKHRQQIPTSRLSSESCFALKRSIDTSGISDAPEFDHARELSVYGSIVDASGAGGLMGPLPRSLPNGVPLGPRYHRLLTYFTDNILASLSCHPSIHYELCQGLVPATLQSPQLLSACLALSAAGFSSRGLSYVDGIDVNRILGHLQSSGLPLLRTALDSGQMDETVLATCVIWCLADVFTYRQGESSWRIHLQGIKAILDSNQAHRHFISGTGSTQVAMRHLYQLYISLQTLPYIPSLPDPETPVYKGLSDPSKMDVLSLSPSDTKIDGFLGYSEELLHILQRIDHLSSLDDQDSSAVNCEADILLGKVKGMIQRDSEISPTVSICASLSPEDTHEFALCHRTFQQATLIHLYRRLYHLPSRAKPLQTAIESIKEMMNFMVQGQPCHTWVAMAMPLFTIGCEAFTDDQEKFVMDKVNKLEECIGSLHVKIIRQALEDIWEVRKRMGDLEGNICASQLLAELRYNIILF